MIHGGYVGSHCVGGDCQGALPAHQSAQGSSLYHCAGLQVWLRTAEMDDKVFVLVEVDVDIEGATERYQQAGKCTSKVYKKILKFLI